MVISALMVVQNGVKRRAQPVNFPDLIFRQTSLAAISDRNAKKNFQPVDGVSVLDKLAAMPIQEWNYKWE
jgi:hypothetical protein